MVPLLTRYITKTVLEGGLPNALSEIYRTGALMLLLILIHTTCNFYVDYRGHAIGAMMESEKVVQDSLEALAENRTTLVIAHRLSTIRNAKRILVLTDQGIDEQGTHEELMILDGIYARLYNISRSRNDQEKPENRGAGPSAPAPLFSGILSTFVKY